MPPPAPIRAESPASYYDLPRLQLANEKAETVVDEVRDKIPGERFSEAALS